MKTVDARGRACPEPVILTAQALPEAPEGLTVLVDHVCAVENITRLAEHKGMQVQVQQSDDEYTLTLTR